MENLKIEKPNMKKEDKIREITTFCEKQLPLVHYDEMVIIKALCTAAYNMGLDDGKQNSTLEIIGGDAIIEAINKKREAN